MRSISACHFCQKGLLRCKCKWGDDIKFWFKGRAIIDPTRDPTRLFFVDPWIEYGNLYIEWLFNWQ